MNCYRLPLYLITATETGYINQHGNTFDANFYSRFKYGSHSNAAGYARELSMKVFSQYHKWKDEEVFITGSAYKVAPTASGAIADIMFEYLRPHFLNLRQVKINRESLFPNDYGSLSLSERNELMEQNRLWVDAELLQGKKLIVVDDLRVTGAHEKKIMQLMGGIVEELLFVYVGQLVGEYLPCTESRINHAAIQSVKDLRDIIDEGNFHINARICKYLLSYQDTAGLHSFLKGLSVDVLEGLHNCICGDGYDQMPEYSRNFGYLKELLEEKLASFTAA